MVTSWPATIASRRSRTTPPIRANALCCVPTCQGPRRRVVDIIANELSWVGPATEAPDRGTGRPPMLAVGRSAVMGTMLGVGLGGKCGLEPLVEFVDVDAALPVRLPQHLGDLLALLVG